MATDRATLRNLLARFGYASVDGIREEGREEGRVARAVVALRAAIGSVMAARGLPAGAEQCGRIQEMSDLNTLRTWLAAAAVAYSSDEIR